VALLLFQIDIIPDPKNISIKAGKMGMHPC
jgi:hypothetical protein